MCVDVGAAMAGRARALGAYLPTRKPALSLRYHGRIFATLLPTLFRCHYTTFS